MRWSTTCDPYSRVLVLSYCSIVFLVTWHGIGSLIIVGCYVGGAPMGFEIFRVISSVHSFVVVSLFPLLVGIF